MSILWAVRAGTFTRAETVFCVRRARFTVLSGERCTFWFEIEITHVCFLEVEWIYSTTFESKVLNIENFAHSSWKLDIIFNQPVLRLSFNKAASHSSRSRPSYKSDSCAGWAWQCRLSNVIPRAGKSHKCLPVACAQLDLVQVLLALWLELDPIIDFEQDPLVELNS